MSFEYHPEEVEEDTKEHFEKLYECDTQFREAWNSRLLQRELEDRILERRLEGGLSQRPR